MNSQRQAVTVVSVDGLRIEGCSLEDSNGSLPPSGIAFRPNYAYERLMGIIVRDCELHGNLSAQLLVDGACLDYRSQPVDIVVDQCLLSTLAYSPAQALIVLRMGFHGRVDIQGSVLVVGRQVCAVRVESPTMTAEWQWGQVVSGAIAVAEFSHDGEGVGTLVLQDCVVMADDEPSDGGGPLAVTAVTSQVVRGRPALVRFRRNDGDLDRPVAVRYRTTGTAEERRDYGGVAHAAVIPAGEEELVVPIRTFPGKASRELEIVLSPTGQSRQVATVELSRGGSH